MLSLSSKDRAPSGAPGEACSPDSATGTSDCRFLKQRRGPRCARPGRADGGARGSGRLFRYSALELSRWAGSGGRLSRIGPPVTLEVPRPGRRCLRGAFSVNTTENAPRSRGAGAGTPVTAREMTQESQQHQGNLLTGSDHCARGAAVRGADHGGRRSRAQLPSRLSCHPGLPGRRRVGPAFAQRGSRERKRGSRERKRGSRERKRGGLARGLGARGSGAFPRILRNSRPASGRGGAGRGQETGAGSGDGAGVRRRGVRRRGRGQELGGVRRRGVRRRERGQEPGRRASAGGRLRGRQPGGGSRG
jgi:hypothetical protein